MRNTGRTPVRRTESDRKADKWKECLETAVIGLLTAMMGALGVITFAAAFVGADLENWNKALLAAAFLGITALIWAVLMFPGTSGKETDKRPYIL